MGSGAITMYHGKRASHSRGHSHGQHTIHNTQRTMDGRNGNRVMHNTPWTMNGGEAEAMAGGDEG